MTGFWKPLVLAILALAGIGWITQHDSSAHSRYATDHDANTAVDRVCNRHDPFAHCASRHIGYPVGDGLSVVLVEDLF
jgi:hypothetical protein